LKKYVLMVIVFLLALFSKSGAHSQDRIEADPSDVQLESPVKVGLDVPIASTDEPWTSGGPIGGYVTHLAIAPSNPDIMYAGSVGGDIYKTSDGGATWTWVSAIYKYYEIPPRTAFARFRDLQIAPDNPELIYAGTDWGLYISQNGGRDWTNTLGDNYVNSIAVDPSNPSNILIGTGPFSEIIGILKSTDGGMNWQEKLLEVSVDSVETILFDTNDAQTVYAGTTGYYGGGLHKSTDGGETWIPLEVSSGHNVYALAMTPSGFSPATIYANTGNYGEDYYASTDQGATWDALLKPDMALGYLCVSYLVVDPGNAKQFYTSGPDSLYKYDSDTEQWTEIASGVFSIRPSSMVISPQNGDLFVGASKGGFFKSIDGGSQWVSSNLINTYINDLAIDPNDSQTAYAAVDGIGFSLAKTNNSGDAWDYLVNSETDLSAVAIDPQNPATIYAADDVMDMEDKYVAFIYKSVNSGQDWEKIPYMRCVVGECEIVNTKILVSATNPKNILVGGTGDNGLLARTTDGGISWDEIDTNTTTTALAADPNNPDIVYGGSENSINFLFRYTDVWGNWTYTTIFGPVGMGTVRDIAVDQGSRVWCAASDGLRRWEEGADKTHFTNIPTDDIMAVTIDRSVSPNAVYIGTHGMGVYVSKDDGASWTAMNDGLGSLFVTNLQVSASQPKVLYAGTENMGVWSKMIENGQIISIPLYLPLMLTE
jgi:photosystem II stability/assembly factor-like uncharacterized protein